MGSAFTTGTEAGQQGENQNQITTGLQFGNNSVTVSDSGAIGAAVDLGTGAFDLSRQIAAEGRVANQGFLDVSTGLFAKFADTLSGTAARANDLAGRTGDALVNLVSKQTTGESVTADKNRSWIPWAIGGAVLFAFLLSLRSKKS